MEARILFDKGGIDSKLSIGWGFSCLIDGRILFDTGESGIFLLNNMGIMNINISKIEAVVISHDHWDHTGGLWELLKKKTGVTVYACPHFSREFKEKVKESKGVLIEADKLKEISRNIFVSGEIPGAYHGRHMQEQALIIKTENGITIITGCAHPGIVKMVRVIKEKFPGERVYSVLGGFHLMEEDKRAVEIAAERFKEMNVKKAGPTHCSGKEAERIFKDKYGNDFIPVKVGQTLDV
ncbi:MAG: MBL fold metallo-hydrolase [Candidatus Omnitrophica bacterium]|nr:MBL fold metallo-hydrolase [Candidatus Omnitrophota bacterium]